MRKLLLCFFSIICFSLSTDLVAQPAIEWDRTLGGLSIDVLYDIFPTADGGYILAGSSSSNAEYEKSEDIRGGQDARFAPDFWIVKIGANGDIQWDKTYGGSGNDRLASVEQTTDGGYILGGVSTSDVYGEKSEAGRGLNDYWIIKVNPQGVVEWDRTLGGNSEETLVAVRQLASGEFIAVGNSISGLSGDKTASPLGAGGSDFWIVKLSASGDLLWDKIAGTTGYDRATCINLTSDGGFIVGGTHSQDSRGPFYIMKLNSSGVEEWSDLIGVDYAFSLVQDIQQTQDGGYVVGGWTYAFANEDQSEDAESGQYWIIKLNQNHEIEWDEVVGTTPDIDGSEGLDELRKIVQTPDGGYLLAGFTNQNARGDKSEDSFGEQDYWIVKLDGNGQLKWDKTIGSGSNDWLAAACVGADGGYLLAGISFSNTGGNKTEPQRGGLDYWIVKLASEVSFPVRLINFTAETELAGINLHWQTSSETQSDRFEVEHSQNGITWQQIGMLGAKGESDALKSYQFTHPNPTRGDNYYRLKMIDIDGSFTYSKIEVVKFYIGFDISVYPNPAVETIKFQTSDWSQVKDLNILNGRGKVLYSSGQSPSQEISSKTFKPGIYFINLTLADGSKVTRKIAIGQ
ncbi:T9SS type A sorting domain-containing protein [Dyadobacter fanqingshengii]|uniref:T9SS type A sorting domain-containing protein n=1 Tax=Dyadobacter fanqingshengii TaxID=2906443 RepID=A0A9X1PBA1_9BACT|nr:T9SS type A sorting domain-containing protein [Dyadobacter fanqingshengii]MCF0040107.1 T9SS type A sorting domain-containing protein [Dyadobacter fanqingshengii]USJ38141.1 T9SS type A sorting domain-containing protein [Dyadobacter fanqingshengii]